MTTPNAGDGYPFPIPTWRPTMADPLTEAEYRDQLVMCALAKDRDEALAALTEERRAHERTRGEVERLRNGLPSPDSIRYGIEPEPWEGNGPCADCEGRSPYWHVPDEIWDAVMGDVSAGVVCPVCFTIRAWKAGIDGWDRQWWWLPSPDFLAVPNADFIRAMDELIATEATLEARNREVERLAKALEDIANRSTACRVSGCDRNFCEHYIAGISPHDFAVAALATPPPTPGIS